MLLQMFSKYFPVRRTVAKTFTPLFYFNHKFSKRNGVYTVFL